MCKIFTFLAFLLPQLKAYASKKEENVKRTPYHATITKLDCAMVDKADSVVFPTKVLLFQNYSKEIYPVCLFLISFEEHYKQIDSFGFVYTQSPTNLARIKEVHVNKTLYPVPGLTQADCVEDHCPDSAVCLSQVVK